MLMYIRGPARTERADNGHPLVEKEKHPPTP